MLTLSAVKETLRGETRVALTPDSVKLAKNWGVKFTIQKDAGMNAGFRDEDYSKAGIETVDTESAWQADVVLKINPPSIEEAKKLRTGSLLISQLNPFHTKQLQSQLAAQGVNVIAMERIPRTSRAQIMDVLSSQANLAGYRAALQAFAHYPRIAPMMMTSAGSVKQAKVVILGVGVAGLQAIATARRIGASVEAYDVRPETREQVLSLGAKFIDVDVGESGAGGGGYARELSEDAKKKLREGLNSRLAKADIIITTANIPGKKAPVLVEEEVVRSMRPGSVIVDMAAASGGNCPLSVADEIVTKHGVTLVGISNFAALVPYDASNFYARNLLNLLALMIKDGTLHFPLEDDIIKAALLIHNGEIKE